MAYKAFLNNKRLFLDTTAHDDLYLLTDARLEMKAGTAGEFTFTVPPDNAVHGQLKRLTDYVDVFRDDELIFAGRIYDIKDRFDTQQTITCEGLLAVLNDSIFRPATFQGNLHDLVRAIITSHNEQVEEQKRISIDRLTIPNVSVYREFLNYETSIGRLKDLVASFGGYMSVEKAYTPGRSAIAGEAVAGMARVGNSTETILKFKWLEDFDEGCEQKIELGSNLLDMVTEQNSDGIITVLVPTGADLENGGKVTIEEVNGGKDYITAPLKFIRQYGYIVGTRNWQDVHEPANLLAKARSYLNSCLTQRYYMDVSAVDLSDAGFDIESFRIGQKIAFNANNNVLPGSVGIAGIAVAGEAVVGSTSGKQYIYFNCQEQKLDLLHPANNKLKLGLAYIGYVQAQRMNSADAIVEKAAQTFVTRPSMELAIDRATNRVTGADGGHVILHDSDLDGEPDEILIMDTPDIATARRVWRWNSAGLGYSSTGYNGRYGLAMTIDGEIVADFITTGQLDSSVIKALSITADKIAAGAITAGKIDASAITSDKIAAGAITADKIAAGAVTAGKLDADAVTANNIAAGAVTSAKIDAGAITTDKLDAGAVTAAKIDTADLFAQNLTASNFHITGGNINIETDQNSSYITFYSNLSGTTGLKTEISASAVTKRTYGNGTEVLRSQLSSQNIVFTNLSNNKVGRLSANKLTLADKMFKTVEIPIQLTIPAGTINYAEGFDVVVPGSGWECVGFGGWYFNEPAPQLTVYKAYIASDYFWYGIGNLGSSAKTVTFTYVAILSNTI